MSDVNKEMRKDLADFNLKHIEVLQTTAKTLLERGIARVHYGVDYFNDDGAPAEYAVLAYNDGRVEELDEWLEDLDYDVFQFQMRYCQPYTFDTQKAQVFFDDNGGSINTEENVIRMYHSVNRREMLESIAEEEISDLELLSYGNNQVIQPVVEGMRTKGIERIFFGVDSVDGIYPVSNWGFVEYTNGKTTTLEHFPTELEKILEVIDELPSLGAYSFSSEGMFADDEGGGMVEISETVSRAYHTPEQREALEKQITKN